MSFQAGDSIQDQLFLVVSRTFAASGPFLRMKLRDREGEIGAKKWSESEGDRAHSEEDGFIFVSGQVSEYNGKPEITITSLRRAAEGEASAQDFQEKSPTDNYNPESALRGLCDNYVSKFADPDLKRLVMAFLQDPELVSRLHVAPAATKLHHAWVGGLVEHILDLVRLCFRVAPQYADLVNRDLLVTGAILHDIGKIFELSYERSFCYSLQGQLLGHISIAHGMLHRKLATDPTLQDFPPKLLLLVEHMLLSHHGKLEFGSPKLPMTPEALLLSALDDLEAKFSAMRREFRAAEKALRPANQPTEWVRSMERVLFDSGRFLREPETALDDSCSGPGEEPAVSVQPCPAEEDQAAAADQDGQPQHGTAQEGAAQEGIAQEGAPQEGAAQEGTAQQGIESTVPSEPQHVPLTTE